MNNAAAELINDGGGVLNRLINEAISVQQLWCYLFIMHNFYFAVISLWTPNVVIASNLPLVMYKKSRYIYMKYILLCVIYIYKDN